jgi:hypothetical protein
MENPYLQSHMAVAAGPFKIRATLAQSGSLGNAKSLTKS